MLVNRFFTLEQPSMSIDASKFLHANKSRFLKYYHFVLFDFYSFIGRHSESIYQYKKKSQKV